MLTANLLCVFIFFSECERDGDAVAGSSTSLLSIPSTEGAHFFQAEERIQVYKKLTGLKWLW